MLGCTPILQLDCDVAAPNLIICVPLWLLIHGAKQRLDMYRLKWKLFAIFYSFEGNMKGGNLKEPKLLFSSLVWLVPVLVIEARRELGSEKKIGVALIYQICQYKSEIAKIWSLPTILLDLTSYTFIFIVNYLLTAIRGLCANMHIVISSYFSAHK
jgi:hypothetical protein